MMLSSFKKRFRAVLFDAYGTLIDVGQARNPYRRMFLLASREIVRQERQRIQIECLTRKVELRELAEMLKVKATSAVMRDLENQLYEELRSIRLKKFARELTHLLRSEGIAVGVCSNVAWPYIKPANDQLSELSEILVWSCVVGAAKPDPMIFDHSVALLAQPKGSVIMIGNSYSCDFVGAKKAGLEACLLGPRLGPRSATLETIYKQLRADAN